MKTSKLFYLFLLTSLLSLSTLLYSQEQTVTVTANSEDISYGLDLKVVAQLFAQSKTTEEFEMILNNPDSTFNNLDINGDGEVDYLRVIETGEGNNRLIVLQAVLAKDIYQDVASIYVEKNEQQEVSIQVIGNEYVYGTNYIIEPVYIYRPLIYDWLWSGRWYSWYSPWYWGYYPRWWHHHSCLTYFWYIDRCHRFHRYHHNCSYRHGHHPHHGYEHHRGHVTRNDYAERHPDNSFNRRHVEMRNARELHGNKGGQSRSNRDMKAVRFGNNIHVQQRSQQGVSRSSASQTTNRTSTSSTSHTQQRHTTSNNGSRTQQNTSSGSYTRTSSSTQQKPNNGQRTSSSTQSYNRSSSTQTRQSTSTYSRQPSSSSHSSYSGGSHSRGGGGYSSSSHSSGSVSRGGGGSPSRSSGGGQRSGGGRR